MNCNQIRKKLPLSDRKTSDLDEINNVSAVALTIARAQSWTKWRRQKTI